MKIINKLLLNLLITLTFMGSLLANESDSNLIQSSDLKLVQEASEKARSKNKAKIYVDPQGKKWVVKNLEGKYKNHLIVQEYIGAKLLKFIQREGIAEVRLVKDLPGHVAAEYMEGFNTSEYFVKTFGIEWDGLHINTDAYGAKSYRNYLLKTNILNKEISNYEELWASMDFVGLEDRTIWNQGYIIKDDGSIIAARVDYDFSFGYQTPLDDSLLENHSLTAPLIALMKQAGWDMNKYYAHLSEISKIPASKFIEIIEDAARTLKSTYPEILLSHKFDVLNHERLKKGLDNYMEYYDFDGYINYIKTKLREKHALIQDVVKKMNQDLDKKEL